MFIAVLAVQLLPARLYSSVVATGTVVLPPNDKAASVVSPAPPNNLDARDLGAGARGPVLPTAAPVAPEVPAETAPPAIPQMPPEIAKAPKKVQDAWLLAQSKPSIAGAASLSPEALNFTAKQK